jgi:hypothetical protein
VKPIQPVVGGRRDLAPDILLQINA